MKVLMTAYNSQEYIEQSLKSIPNNIEIIIGVDGCEKTLNKLIEIKDNFKNLSIMWCPDNKGTYITRNTLIHHCDSDVIVFLDSDDLYIKKLFDKISENILKYDVIRWSYNSLYENGTVIKTPLNSYYTHANGVFACKKNIFNKFGGYKDWRFSADYDLQIRIEKSDIKILKIDEHLMYYRQHTSSLSRTVPINNRVNIEKSLGGNEYVEPVIHNNFKWI